MPDKTNQTESASQQRASADGLWEACLGMESIARAHLQADLGLVSKAFKLIYELGVEAPTLPSKRETTDLRVAAMFLKRMLHDLRGVWLLIERGYTSQAAAVAASLWENALATACIAGHPSRASEVLETPKKLPWRPVELAKTHARDVTARIPNAKRNTQFELRWREHYGGYKWLCQLKHPTLNSARHDSASTADDSDDPAFVVMVAPDLRPSDRGMKLGVATVALQQAIAAVSGFAEAARCEDTPRYRNWIDRCKEASLIVIEHQKGSDRPALTLDADESLLREYEKFRMQQENAGNP